MGYVILLITVKTWCNNLISYQLVHPKGFWNETVEIQAEKKKKNSEMELFPKQNYVFLPFLCLFWNGDFPSACLCVSRRSIDFCVLMRKKAMQFLSYLPVGMSGLIALWGR